MTPRHDIILAGGGAPNSLILLRLAQKRPELQVKAIVRGGAAIGSNHTWSSFAHVDLDQREWTAPLFSTAGAPQSAFPRRRGLWQREYSGCIGAAQSRRKTIPAAPHPHRNADRCITRPA
jgi:hypothetical protein